ncbi:hypothetical protein [Prochlorococcus sp. MIT 1341]|uniref:hypothetical protein n=1 Tax=Prochlorococcus sp. MIT 1341 TaxID=3096221 RepID=UPI002A756951|nr:hypothetical protein [Prochlorococcus sp. MIT 1341]
MQRSNAFLWIALAFLLLLPTAAGRVLLDLVGGLMVLSLAIPVLLGGIGWVGWKILQSNIVTCQGCGNRIFSKSVQCPICGSSSFRDADVNDANSSGSSSIPASSATIDITAEDVESE